MNKISKQEFTIWKNDPVTKAVFGSLLELRDSLNESLTDAEIIIADRDKILRLLGQREGLDVLLQIEVQDVSEEEQTLSR